MRTKYTNEQLSVILAPETKKLIRASAGTGKTATLVGAVDHVIRHQRDSSKIAVFTFTRKAAAELKERLEVIPEFVGTIHGFALREIAKMEEMGLLYSEIMPEEKMRRLLLNSYIHTFELKRGYQEEVRDIFDYMVNRDVIPDRPQAQRYAKVINHYVKRKRELGLYDFTDAPQYLYEKMQETNYKLEFTHLFVDEVQDIDVWEYQIIADFKGEVFAIGDPRQNIYQFRNSIGRIFDKLENLGYNLYILTKNFRSYQEILDYSKSYLDAHRGKGGKIVGAELLRDDDVTILCRYNDHVRQLSPFFNDVGTIHSFKGMEFDKVFVVEFEVYTEEDSNVRFVAYTRARDVLGLGTLDEALEIGRRKKYGF